MMRWTFEKGICAHLTNVQRQDNNPCFFLDDKIILPITPYIHQLSVFIRIASPSSQTLYLSGENASNYHEIYILDFLQSNQKAKLALKTKPGNK